MFRQKHSYFRSGLETVARRAMRPGPAVQKSLFPGPGRHGRQNAPDPLRCLRSPQSGRSAVGPSRGLACGAAPWHDDPQVCARLAARLPGCARVCSFLHGAEVCALIAGATACLASSLHALLVAAAFGVPRWGLERRPGAGAKLRAYAETWGLFAVGAVQQFPPRWRSQQGL